MPLKTPMFLATLLMPLLCGAAFAQSSQSTQATSPGQSGSSNTLPQPPSGGRASPAGGGTGSPATGAGAETEQERQADTQARKATGAVCQGC